MDNKKYNMLKGYLLALSKIKFEKYITYDFIFDKIDYVETQFDINNVFRKYVSDNYNDLDKRRIEIPEIVMIEDWKEKVFEDDLNDFDFGFDNKVVLVLFSLINDFFDNDIKVWKVRRGLNLGLYQIMYIFKKDMDFYIFQAYKDD